MAIPIRLTLLRGGERLMAVGGALGWEPGFFLPGPCGGTLDQRVFVAPVVHVVPAAALGSLQLATKSQTSLQKEMAVFTTADQDGESIYSDHEPCALDEAQ